MKKIYLIIVLALLGTSANAQLFSKDYKCFKLGEYEFYSPSFTSELQEKGGGVYYLSNKLVDMDICEKQRLCLFITTFKKEIEDKFKLIIMSVKDDTIFTIQVYDKYVYNKYKYQQEVMEKQQKAREESLYKIF